jgi:hypothetical protein
LARREARDMKSNVKTAVRGLVMSMDTKFPAANSYGR